MTVDLTQIQDLDDLKQLLFGSNEKGIYTGHFKGAQLSADASTPTDTTVDNPLIFRKGILCKYKRKIISIDIISGGPESKYLVWQLSEKSFF